MKKLLLCIGLLIASADISWAQAITATGREIKQGDDVIATYTRKEILKPDNTVEMVMTFVNTSGETVATAVIPYQQKGKKTVIKTEKDNKTVLVELTKTADVEMAAEIATQLSTNKYL